jgi:hypothetical protein
MIPRTISRPLWFAALGAAVWANRDNLRRGTRSVQHAIAQRRHPPASRLDTEPSERVVGSIKQHADATRFQ